MMKIQKTMFYYFRDVRKYRNLSQKKRNRKYKENKYKKFLALFNVHVGLHLTDMTRKYVIMMNLNVLLYEMKHM